MRSRRSRPGRASTSRSPRRLTRVGSGSSTPTSGRGALTYLAALDIGRRGRRRPRVFGRSEPRGGIDSFDRLVFQVMSKEPYASAKRVFWIVDNGSSHRGRKAVERLQRRWPNLALVHLPVHASLAQPDRDLLLDRPAQGPRAKRLPTRGRARPHPQHLRAPLERGRRTLRVELHPRRPRCANRASCSPRVSAPTGRMMASELTAGST